MLSFSTDDDLTLPRIGKLAFDWVGAAFLLVLLSPLMAAIALAVKLDGSPVLYAHTRLGMRRQRFGCLKFRSTRTGQSGTD